MEINHFHKNQLFPKAWNVLENRHWLTKERYQFLRWIWEKKTKLVQAKLTQLSNGANVINKFYPSVTRLFIDSVLQLVKTSQVTCNSYHTYTPGLQIFLFVLCILHAKFIPFSLDCYISLVDLIFNKKKS